MNLGFEKNIPRYESRTESMMQLDWAEKVIVRRLSVCLFSCGFFTFFIIEYDGFYIMLELVKVNQDQDIFLIRCGINICFTYL